jgi:hypothetical protein
MAGTADLASPPVLSPHAQVASAPTLQCPTRDECDIHDMVSEQADIIINKPAWDGVYHRFFLASVIFSSLLVHVPLIPALWLVFPFFERAIFVLFFSLFIHCTTRPDQVFSLLNTASLGGMHVGHFNGRR